MRRMRPRPTFSFRDDPDVPPFDDAKPLALLDGECALCSAGARLIDRMDRSGEVRICTSQSPLGRALLAHYGLQADDPESWLLIEGGCAYLEFDAVFRLGQRCGLLGRLLIVLRLLPAGWRSALYRHVARNRIRWFGRAELCALPSPTLRARLVE